MKTGKINMKWMIPVGFALIATGLFFLIVGIVLGVDESYKQTSVTVINTSSSTYVSKNTINWGFIWLIVVSVLFASVGVIMLLAKHFCKNDGVDASEERVEIVALNKRRVVEYNVIESCKVTPLGMMFILKTQQSKITPLLLTNKDEVASFINKKLISK